MIKRLIILIYVLSGISQLLISQEITGIQKRPDHFEVADELYEAQHYYEAIEFYVSGLENQPKKREAIKRLADCYIFSRQYEKAIETYKTYIEETRQVDGLVYYHLCEAHRAMGNYTKAKQFCQQALQAPLSNTYKKKTEQSIASCDFAMTSLSNPIETSIEPLPRSIHSGRSSYSPKLVLDTLWFIVNQQEKKRGQVKLEGELKGVYRQQYTASPYYSYPHEGAWVLAEPIENKSGTKGEIRSVYPIGKGTVFVTLCGENEKKERQCHIYRGKYNKAFEITSLEKIKIPVNTDNSNSIDPSYQETGSGRYIFFASDRHGTNGGYDIYHCTLDQDFIPIACHNAGNVINTEEDEVSPFYDPLLKRFYFSSKGHKGMGGFDILYVEGAPGEKFSDPSNPGYPINTGSDEVDYKHYRIKGNYYRALHSSNRPASDTSTSTCCNHIYDFRYHIVADNKISVEFSIFDSATKDTLHASTLQVIEKESQHTIYNEKAEQSNLHRTSLEKENTYRILVKKAGYEKKEFSIETQKSRKEIAIYLQKEKKEIPIEKEPEPEPEPEPIPEPPVETAAITATETLVLPTIYHPFGKGLFPPKEKEKLDKLARQLTSDYPEIKIVIASHTDNIDSRKFNMKLSEQRNEAVMAYLAERGVDRKRMLGQWYGEEMPAVPNQKPNGKDNPEGRALNRRSEIKAVESFDGLQAGQMIEIPDVDPTQFVAQKTDIEIDEVTLAILIDRHGNKQVEGLEFRIQVGAYAQLEKYKSYREQLHTRIKRECNVSISTEAAGQFTRFLTSGVSTLKEGKNIEQHIRNLNIPGAFMVPYYKGKRIHLLDAIELFGEL